MSAFSSGDKVSDFGLVTVVREPEVGWPRDRYVVRSRDSLPMYEEVIRNRGHKVESRQIEEEMEKETRRQ